MRWSPRWRTKSTWCSTGARHGVPALLAKVYDPLGRAADATRARQRCVERAERTLALNPLDARALYLGATALAGPEDRCRAAEWIERACAIAPDDPVTRHYAACGYARIGQAATALGCLEQAIGLGFRHRAWTLSKPDFEPVRDEPRFRALLGRASAGALAVTGRVGPPPAGAPDGSVPRTGPISRRRRRASR